MSLTASVTERISKRDLSRGWLPITAVVSIVMVAVATVWWLAAEHADIATAKAQAASATAQAQSVAVDLRTLTDRQAGEIAALRTGQAVTEANLVAIRAQLDRIEVHLRDPR